MITMKSKLKSPDFYRKIPQGSIEATRSGAGLSMIAALVMFLLFGMVAASSSIIVDDEHSYGGVTVLLIKFNISFPALSCEFASADVSDALGMERKTIRKFSIDPISLNDEESNEEHEQGSISLNARNFDRVAQQHGILLVNFFAPWCHWSNRLKTSWEKAANITREKYGSERHIVLGKVDCSIEKDLCRRHHIDVYPSIRVFPKGSDFRVDDRRHYRHQYLGHRDTDSLLKFVEGLVAVAPNPSLNHTLAAPEGCRIEGFVRLNQAPEHLIISAHSASHSFDASKMDMSHVRSGIAVGLRYYHETLNGCTFGTQPDTSDANVTANGALVAQMHFRGDHHCDWHFNKPPAVHLAPAATLTASEIKSNLAEVISLLRGNGLTRFASRLDLVQDNLISVMRRHAISGYTIFAPEDPAFDEFSPRRYIAEGRFEFKDLAALPNKTLLRTLNLNKDLEITTTTPEFNGTARETVSVEGAVVTKADVYFNRVFVVHTISRPFKQAALNPYASYIEGFNSLSRKHRNEILRMGSSTRGAISSHLLADI